MSLQVAVFAQMNDVLDVALAILVPGMRFSCKDKLHRTLFLAGEFDDVLKLLKDERRAFIRGKAASETDRQRVGIEQLIEGDEIPLAEALALEEEAAAGELDQFTPQLVPERPQFLIQDEIG